MKTRVCLKYFVNDCSIAGLATTAALTAVENKIPKVSNLIKKTDKDAKISATENAYITTADCNKLIKDNVAERVKKKKFLERVILLI